MIGQLDPVALKWGPFSIRWYAIFIVSGMILALYLSIFEGKKHGFKEDDFIDFLLIGLPFSLLGARLYYVIFEWSYYKTHLNEIIAIWNGGIAIYGGLIAGAVTLYFFCKKREFSFFKYLDILAPGVLLAQGIGRWGNFFNHEAYGPKTTLEHLKQLHLPQIIIKNMYIDGFYRVPTFLYESLWAIVGFIFLILLRRYKKVKTGEIFLSYLLFYSLGRYFIEGLRTDSLYLVNHIRVSQVVSFLLFFGSIGLFIYRRFVKKEVTLYQTYH